MAKKRALDTFSFRSLSFFSSLKNERIKAITGLILLLLAVYIGLALISFLIIGGADQSKIENLSTRELFDRGSGIQNWCGAIGALLSNWLINQTFGVGTLFVPVFIGGVGLRLIRPFQMGLPRLFFICFVSMMWVSLFSAVMLKWFYEDTFIYLGGRMGYDLGELMIATIGLLGTVITIIALFFIISILINIGVIGLIGRLFKKPDLSKFKSAPPSSSSVETAPTTSMSGESTIANNGPVTPVGKEIEWIISRGDDNEAAETAQPISGHTTPPEKSLPVDVPFTIDDAANDEEDDEWSGNGQGEYDPTLDLSHYKYPSTDLLTMYDSNENLINMEEQNANKNRIVEVLRNFDIEIQSIKATPGPTVTLYEIVPEAGIRIAKIRNLEDDIALSLAALGIRIIAPLPGKGTIGIEVPNKDPQIVSMRTILNSSKFRESKMDLPIALGKTITNEIFIVDLAKMPHILVAGATGQGKSVGLNAIIASLIYKKHPSQLKFVLVDPKKVEFTIYSTIEKHFLAKLPDSEEPIITDVTKVVQTLTSITREMDERYDLLKKAHVRNVKEYNQKFVARKLNPEKGHRFLPYIVVIIDEFGDLIMTAGKEVELPIARIAQLARAVGIHMVIATQRPSTNIITGTIKANFPARIAFRVSAMVDSRTILDCPGANQLIGRGDMLFSQGGGDLIRVQCAFIDTPEVESVAEFIGNQQGYSTAYYLPEVTTDESVGAGDVDMNNLDPLFEEAARLIVISQQGSTSMIQRKLSLGYNRSGRLMDQLEKAGIVGPSEGSKPRQVLVMDEYQLDMLLRQIK